MTLQTINSNIHHLFVKKVVLAEERAELCRIALIWSRVADQKMEFCDNNTEKEMFSDCSFICSIINNTSFRLDSYVCFDNQSDTLGMMCLSILEDEILVLALASNPFHIRATPNYNINFKTRGAGTFLLKTAEEIALREGKKAISLSSTLSAKAFYWKNGFKEEEEEEDRMVKTIPYFASTSSN